MKKELTLHTCCAPCLSGAFDYLKSDFEIRLFWFNPNIFPENEYQKRLKEVKRYAKIIKANLKVIDGDYGEEHQEWLKYVRGFENEPEGGERCKKCFEYRLKKVFVSVGDKPFTTTLTISPYKNADDINKIGKKTSKEYLTFDFNSLGCNKKSLEITKEFNIYRQKYCGCEFSYK